MEKSFLNFKINHPDWDCGEQGEKFVATICAFQEQRLEELAASQIGQHGHGPSALAGYPPGLGHPVNVCVCVCACVHMYVYVYV